MSAGGPRVYIALSIPDAALARIEAECAVERFTGDGRPSRDELLAALAEAEGVLGSAQQLIDAEVLAAAPNLRVVSNFGVGFDNVDIAAATRRGIVVCNTPGVLSEAVADLTLGLILSLARRLPESERFVREGRWLPGATMSLGTDVAGKTLGIVGLGRIGQAVARRAQAFGMPVVFHDQVRNPPPDPAVPGKDAAFCSYRELDALLSESDVVSLHVSLTPETEHLIGARELALMKPSAYLINTARGGVVDQAALVAALRAERIAGAALDVFEREPLAADEPILSLPNVILLPHIGSGTVETRSAMLGLAIDNLLAVLRGERPPCLVNPEALGEKR